MVNEDGPQRFELLHDPLKGGDVDSWWIRVKEMDVRFSVLGVSMLPSLNCFPIIGKRC